MIKTRELIPRDSYWHYIKNPQDIEKSIPIIKVYQIKFGQ